MKRAEIENQIEKIVNDSFLNDTPIVDRLTDLFLQLSEERCQEQREICAREQCSDYDLDMDSSRVQNILNAPLPELL